MKRVLRLSLFALVAAGCGGSSTPSGPSGSPQELHKSLTTPDEGVEFPFTWGRAMTTALDDPEANVALFTFAPDPPDPRATIERIVVNRIHADSACPADFQITLISPAGKRFTLWNNEGPCEVAVRKQDGIPVTTFVSNRELSGVAGEPLCMHCTQPAGANRPDDHWKWQVTSLGLSKAVEINSSGTTIPIEGTMADMGMTITFYYKALYK